MNATRIMPWATGRCCGVQGSSASRWLTGRKPPSAMPDSTSTGMNSHTGICSASSAMHRPDRDKASTASARLSKRSLRLPPLSEPISMPAP
ncbi:hypothetical protein BI344_16065 [Chromobacterium sphagni]|uniref:Uncharacterized protein n=1 Tax=Chromobacterium sphagni TaxID=1903179 RepID=A0ABX3CCK7_9NEIS|nr:hypothetical protein BI344_16065 [Chromobacterium sphagni]